LRLLGAREERSSGSFDFLRRRRRGDPAVRIGDWKIGVSLFAVAEDREIEFRGIRDTAKSGRLCDARGAN